MEHLTEQQFLNIVFDKNGTVFGGVIEVNGDDGCGNVFGVVNDLIDSGYSLGDVHAGNTSEMECFEGHLGGRLSDTLSSQSSNGFSRLNNASVDFFDVEIEEKFELNISYTMIAVPYIFLVFLVSYLNPLIVLLQRH